MLDLAGNPLKYPTLKACCSGYGCACTCELTEVEVPGVALAVAAYCC